MGGRAYSASAEMRQQELGVPLPPEPWLHANNASNLPANGQQQRLLACTPRHPPRKTDNGTRTPPSPAPPGLS